MSKKFIVFEGIDGSGTSTQSELLRNALVAKGDGCQITCEPSNGPIGNMIRQIFKGRIRATTGSNPYTRGGNLFDEQMAYLFAADRHDHLYNEIDGVFKILSQGSHVISTRYYFSSYAYHCSREQDFELIQALNSRFPNPDLVVYLDNPVEASMERISTRAFKDHYETREKLISVKKNYDEAFKNYDGRLITLDATLSAEAIHKSILEEVEHQIGYTV